MPQHRFCPLAIGTHENSADEVDGYGIWNMGCGMWDIYIDRMCAPPGPRPSNARSVRQLAEGHEFSCTR